MSMGERGPTGDHGQTGQNGLDGRPGDTGAAGLDAPNQTHQMRVLAVFVLVVGIAVAVYLQIIISRVDDNSQRISGIQAEARYESCLGGKTIIEKYNAQQDALADVERRGLAADPNGNPLTITVRNDRIRIYEQGMLPVPDCDTIKPVGYAPEPTPS